MSTSPELSDVYADYKQKGWEVAELFPETRAEFDDGCFNRGIPRRLGVFGLDRLVLLSVETECTHDSASVDLPTEVSRLAVDAWQLPEQYRRDQLPQITAIDVRSDRGRPLRLFATEAPSTQEVAAWMAMDAEAARPATRRFRPKVLQPAIPFRMPDTESAIPPREPIAYVAFLDVDMARDRMSVGVMGPGSLAIKELTRE